jgi:hypothetical protein
MIIKIESQKNKIAFEKPRAASKGPKAEKKGQVSHLGAIILATILLLTLTLIAVLGAKNVWIAIKTFFGG